MKYVVRLQPVAESDLHEAYLWAAKRAPEAAKRWLARFEDAIASLDTHPQRCGLAAENKRLKIELRELHFGRRPNVFRAVFVVEGLEVRVLRVLRAAMRRLLKRDLGV